MEEGCFQKQAAHRDETARIALGKLRALGVETGFDLVLL